MSDAKYPINLEWRDYYSTLEAIRRSGITNMWGAAPYLKECHSKELSDEQAKEILLSWIANYTELANMYGW